jgi:predicted nucleic acid-binding protein
MVLVDTSVWIRFLANRTPYAQQLEKLLARDEVAAHDLVFGELLVGDRGGRRTLLNAYEGIHTVGTVPHREVIEFVRNRKLHGRGIGWIDVHLLASALVNQLHLWTADSSLQAVALDLNISYRY